jgi:3-oxoacyl-[acyl-carrier-protein] synthase-1
MQNRKIYLHCMSACCSAGQTSEDVFKAVLNGISGVKKHKNYLINGEESAIGKMDFDISFDTLLIDKVQEVLIQSELKTFEDTLLLVGTSVGGMTWAEKQLIKDEGSYKNIELEKQSMQSVALTLKKHFNFKDAITFSTACTSSSNAIVFAKEILEAGAYTNVVVVGADSISYTTVNGFNALGVLSKECSIPFDADRTGMNVAEGIGALLLSTEPSDIQLLGVGCSSDAYNITHPHPEGNGAKLAMYNALKDASLSAEKIDYINAHGTGTVANDTSEGKAILELFPHLPYVGSTKSITGHTLGACGAIEAIISTQVLKQQIIPANRDLKTKELETLNALQKNKQTEVNTVLSNAFAFGGNNVSIILQRVVDEN